MLHGLVGGGGPLLGYLERKIFGGFPGLFVDFDLNVPTYDPFYSVEAEAQT